MAEGSATFRLHIQGTKPLMMHNGRLANPLDPYARQLKAISGKRKKTDEDLLEMVRIEARGGVYETDDGLLGIPNENVWSCLHEAAKAFKRGKDIQRALMTDLIVVPLLIHGEEIKVDDFLSVPEAVDYRPVRVQMSKPMRARPFIYDGWSSSHDFELFTDVIDVRDMAPIIARAGRLVGLCERRPMYGAFTATLEITDE